MEGRILDFKPQNQEGVISADDGQRFSFQISDWHSDTHPARGQRVDFVAKDGGVAAEIYLTVGVTPGLEMTPLLKRALIALACAVLAFLIPFIGLILSVVGLVMGINTRTAAKQEVDDTAATVALIAIVISAISLALALFALLTVLFIGGGMALIGIAAS